MIKISDCVIAGTVIPIVIADKILMNHILPLDNVQKHHNGVISISEKSCYRPPIYEKKKGRSITGQHCFIGKGAADVITTGDLEDLLQKLVYYSEYTRICIYGEKLFIHADYRKTDGNIHLYRDWRKFAIIPINTRTERTSKPVRDMR